MPRRRYLFDPPERFVAGTVGRARQPDVLPPGPRRAAGRQHRPREGPGRGPCRSAGRPPRRAREARGSRPPAADRRGRRRHGAPRRADQRGVPGRVADPRLGRRRRADPRRGACAGRGRRGRSTPTKMTTRTRTVPTCCASGSPPRRPLVRRTGARVVASGRPPCPLCGQPLDPQGHICPRRNGHYVN